MLHQGETGKVAEYRKYVYNESSQVVKAEIYDCKKDNQHGIYNG